MQIKTQQQLNNISPMCYHYSFTTENCRCVCTGVASSWKRRSGTSDATTSWRVGLFLFLLRSNRVPWQPLGRTMSVVWTRSKRLAIVRGVHYMWRHKSLFSTPYVGRLWREYGVVEYSATDGLADTETRISLYEFKCLKILSFLRKLFPPLLTDNMQISVMF